MRANLLVYAAGPMRTKATTQAVRNRTDPMTALERRSVTALAGIYGTRLLGLFLILPVFALYAQTLDGYTPQLMGLALGIYGLTQACLQIPFGALSDRLGRKPVITFGLVLFAAGSMVAAGAHSIGAMVLGRALQGSGAVSAAVTAMVADLTRDSQRTKAMAIIGVTVGASFLIAIPLGSALNAMIGVPGIFWLTAALALVGIGILWLAVPTPARTHSPAGAEALLPRLWAVLRDGRLLRLDLGIFALHVALTSTFVVLPNALVDYARLPQNEHAALYLPLMLVSAIPLFPLIGWSERRGRQRQLFAAAILLLTAALAGLSAEHDSLFTIAVGVLFFFIAFNLLEASLPSLVSKTAPPQAKGTAIGVYSTFQFLGAFVGGDRGGWLYQHYGVGAVFGGAAAITGLWFLLALRDAIKAL
jgi:predicted MFS family arabinose efflux permease